MNGLVVLGVGIVLSVSGIQQPHEIVEKQAMACMPCIQEASAVASAQIALDAATNALNVAEEKFAQDPNQQNAAAVASAQIAVAAAQSALNDAEDDLDDCLQNLDGGPIILESTVSILE